MIAAELAHVSGVDQPQEAISYVLRTQLLGAPGPLFLQAELDGQGRLCPGGKRPRLSTEAPWWPAAKLFGRHLRPWMPTRHPLSATA